VAREATWLGDLARKVAGDLDLPLVYRGGYDEATLAGITSLGSRATRTGGKDITWNELRYFPELRDPDAFARLWPDVFVRRLRAPGSSPPDFRGLIAVALVVDPSLAEGAALAALRLARDEDLRDRTFTYFAIRAMNASDDGEAQANEAYLLPKAIAEVLREELEEGDREEIGGNLHALRCLVALGKADRAERIVGEIQRTEEEDGGGVAFGAILTRLTNEAAHYEVFLADHPETDRWIRVVERWHAQGERSGFEDLTRKEIWEFANTCSRCFGRRHPLTVDAFLAAIEQHPFPDDPPAAASDCLWAAIGCQSLYGKPRALALHLAAHELARAAEPPPPSRANRNRRVAVEAVLYAQEAVFTTDIYHHADEDLAVYLRHALERAVAIVESCEDPEVRRFRTRAHRALWNHHAKRLNPDRELEALEAALLLDGAELKRIAALRAGMVYVNTTGRYARARELLEPYLDDGDVGERVTSALGMIKLARFTADRAMLDRLIDRMRGWIADESGADMYRHLIDKATEERTDMKGESDAD